MRYFEFIEKNKKTKVMQTTMLSIYNVLRGSYTDKKCIKKDLTTYHTYQYWIKYPELQAKYVLGQNTLSKMPKESLSTLCNIGDKRQYYENFRNKQ